MLQQKKLEVGCVWCGKTILRWNLLKRLSSDCNCPWLVAGDFNEIMYSFEKRGGLPRDQKRTEVFRDTLEECRLMDVGYSEAWFTWEKGNLPETNIRERLDRGVANEKWFTLFPMGSVQHLPHSFSDHCPLLVHTDTWWTLEDSFEEALKDIWESSSGTLVDKLKTVQTGLKK
ncbi:Exo_endo_phos domain-containing protein [Gossypium australe]|uniref:Exo_endo_phos domain-containing protein n=1 Tax=Gossypium australe TaxID=47621 RepID=A0A5B6VHG8_9ROSI|nr:Exo_endo_phos domain-containing protein [Gossypium australe]